MVLTTGFAFRISARSKAVANEFNLKIMSQEEAMANDALQKQ